MNSFYITTTIASALYDSADPFVSARASNLSDATPKSNATADVIVDAGVGDDTFDVLSTDHANEHNSPCQITARLYINFVLAGSLCLVGMLGNALSFVAIGLDADMAPVARLTLRSLACSDGVMLASWLLAMAVPALLQFAGVHESLSAGWVYLRVYTYPVLFMSQMSTVWLTVLIAVCRYVCVGLPLSAGTRCTLSVVRAAVAAIAVGAFAFNVPRFFARVPAEPWVDDDNVTHYYVERSELAKRYSYKTIYANISYTVVNFAVPFLLLTVFSVLLVHAYHKQQRRRALLKGAPRSGGHRGRGGGGGGGGDNSTTRVIVAVVVVFAVCNLPAKILQIATENNVGCPGPKYLAERFAYVLEVVNSTANFVVYCVMRRQFREALRRALSARRRLRRMKKGGGGGEGTTNGRRRGSRQQADEFADDANRRVQLVPSTTVQSALAWPTRSVSGVTAESGDTLERSSMRASMVESDRAAH